MTSFLTHLEISDIFQAVPGCVEEAVQEYHLPYNTVLR